MDEANAKTRKLEEEYEQTCIEGKVMHLLTSPWCRVVWYFIYKDGFVKKESNPYNLCAKL